MNQEDDLDEPEIHKSRLVEAGDSSDESEEESKKEQTNDIGIDVVNAYFKNNNLPTRISLIGPKIRNARGTLYPIYVIDMPEGDVETFRRFYSSVDSKFNNLLLHDEDENKFELVCM